MKSRVISLIGALVAVLAMAFFTAEFALPFLNNLFGARTYSQTNCLTDAITSDMDIYDIAKAYRDGQATVAVTVKGMNTSNNKYYTSLGSGICVASKGYQTNLENNLMANKGSYIATNYHVVDFFDSSEFVNCSASIVTEDEQSSPCTLLWSNQDLDVAVLYCDSVNINYVRMKDRIVYCEESQRLDYEQIFAIGTPLELDYLNRLTIGNVASNNAMLFYTGQVIYPTYGPGGNITGYKNYSSNGTGYEVLSNTYEDIVDITVGITNGNSGGGCFDANGYLIGLTTLGGNVSSTGGNQMNGIVPIYPIMKVLDKLIENNEADGTNKIYTIEGLNFFGIDQYEASICTSVYSTDFPYYFIDGKFFSLSYSNDFAFEGDGYYILTNSNVALNSIIKGCVIKGGKIEGKQRIEILDRNDLIYLLLDLKNGEEITFYYDNILGFENSVTVSL